MVEERIHGLCVHDSSSRTYSSGEKTRCHVFISHNVYEV